MRRHWQILRLKTTSQIILQISSHFFLLYMNSFLSSTIYLNEMSIVIFHIDKLICLLRYSSDAARNSCTSDDLNNTSSTLRQEAISITRVRCKRRKTWIRSPSSPTQALTNIPLQQRRLKTALIEPFLSTHSSESFWQIQ